MKIPSLALGERLSIWLAAQTFAGLGLVSMAVYLFAAADLDARQNESLQHKRELVEHVLAEAHSDRDLPDLLHKLDDFFLGHRDMVLTLLRPDGQTLYNNASRPDAASRLKWVSFAYPHWDPAGGKLSARMALDTAADDQFLQRLAAALMGASMVGALLVSAGSFVLVRLGLRPVRSLVMQTKGLAAENLHQRLDGSLQPRELQPLVQQFNALLARLNRAYEQLEGFNADVAHELRTPLATLITSTEVAMRQQDLPEATLDLLGSNLEDLRRMAGIVNDMLFLSHANSGTAARREAVKSLAALAHDVAEYHEAAIAEAGLQLRIHGDAAGEFDAPLLKRALSNLLGNATRYATAGSTIQVELSALPDDAVSVAVINEGPAIASTHLPRLFDRFYRADPARARASVNHGLGLSIVAAIARMHGGEPFASSGQGATRIGLTLGSARPAVHGG